MAISDITVDDFKTHFSRDFEYAIPIGMTSSPYDCEQSYVTDLDINKAFSEATINFNEGLFGDDDTLKITFLYLSAHYLCNDLQSSMQGIGSAGQFPVNSRSVGGVSESYNLPDWINDPILGYFSTTRYGQKYVSLIKPLMIGNISVCEGATTFR